jgi:hypothetical protein
VVEPEQGVKGIGSASFLADLGHEVPTALLPSLLLHLLGGVWHRSGSVASAPVSALDVATRGGCNASGVLENARR